MSDLSDLSTAFSPHYYSSDERRTASRLATKRSFGSGKVRRILAGKTPSDVAEIEAGAVTMCFNTVQQFWNGQVVDSFTWEGENYYSRQSDRILYTS